MSENLGEIIIYQTDDGLTKIETKFEQDTVWLSLDQMAELFQRDRSVIGKHVRNVFAEGELNKEAVWAKFAYTASDGKTYYVDYYNLDVIISVGYRVKSIRGTQFRRWATERLKEYLIKGFTMDDERLKGNGGGNYLKEDELKILNNLVSGYFDLAEINAIEHKPMYMIDYVAQLDAVLTSGGRPLLENSGKVSHDEALKKAKEEYRKYQTVVLSPVEEAYIETIRDVNVIARREARKK